MRSKSLRRANYISVFKHFCVENDAYIYNNVKYLTCTQKLQLNVGLSRIYSLCDIVRNHKFL